MEIILQNIGKKFNHDWVFKGINTSFKSESSYAILGTNGSGKSTLINIIAGKLVSSEGTIKYIDKGCLIEVENLYRYISLASPCIELIEEFNLRELYAFHSGMKSMLHGINEISFMEILGLPGVKNKPIRYFSSGMKQRVKLALAFLSNSEILLLDEPCSGLDTHGIDWYSGLFEKFKGERLALICSNHMKEEVFFCTSTLNVNNYK